MPFGVLTLGIHDCWDKGVSHLCDHLGHGDFLIPGPSGARASFAYALGQFRKLLVAIGGLSTAQARNYTLHSLKTTGLTWALQLDVDHVQRRLWGHHRGGDSGSKMTTKYSRDDVLPALRAQLKVLDSVRGGWVPLTPQARGSLPPVPESALSGPLHRLVWTPLGLAAAGPGLDAKGARCSLFCKFVCKQSCVLLLECGTPGTGPCAPWSAVLLVLQFLFANRAVCSCWSVVLQVGAVCALFLSCLWSVNLAWLFFKWFTLTLWLR